MHCFELKKPGVLSGLSSFQRTVDSHVGGRERITLPLINKELMSVKLPFTNVRGGSGGQRPWWHTRECAAP